MSADSIRLDVFIDGRNVLSLASMPADYDERVWMQQIIHLDHVAALLADFREVLQDEVVEHRHQSGIVAEQLMEGVDLDEELRKLTREDEG